jgi:hypothetical protein
VTGPVRRHRVAPLDPPPGQFAAVLREANRRRYHRAAAFCAVTGVFLAGIFGGLAMGGPGGVRSTIVSAAGLGNASTTTVAAPEHSRTTAARSSRSGKVPPVQVRKTYLRGEILNASGAPVSGLYVYSGVLTAHGFVPNKTPARTNGVGWYLIACTGGPLLVTSWPINDPIGPVASGVYAARFIDTPSCATAKHHIVTRVEEGAVVQGDIRADVACPGTELTLWLWIGGDRSASVRLSGLLGGQPLPDHGCSCRDVGRRRPRSHVRRHAGGRTDRRAGRHDGVPDGTHDDPEGDDDADCDTDRHRVIPAD